VTGSARASAQREHVRAAALGLGFDDAAWVSAQPLERDVDTFAAWCADGLHAGMEYLPGSLERRADAQSTFLGARSALVLMVSHNHPDPGVPTGGTRVGRVARYAWSRDYHQALQPALAALERAASLEGVRAKAFVDHAPLLERGYAIRAGLGWRGRSSQTISTRLGALTSLAVLLCDVEPPTDAEHPDRCGRCTACVRACPTDAITVNRSVDARRCIAYYTVEHRGAVPLALRAGFGDHLFGCDDCLDVCPWTTHAGRFSVLLEPDPELAHPDLEPLFTESGHAFLRRCAHSMFARARRRGMARNAAVVLGNTRDPAHAELLARGAQDTGWEVREAVAWALGRMDAGHAALEALTRDADGRVAQTARAALMGAFLEDAVSTPSSGVLGSASRAKTALER
jgi:epoxyqueuosine reductase